MEERRTAHRYKLPLVVVVRRVPMPKESELLHARTRDISTHGVYFTSDQPLAVGMKLGLSLTLPAAVTQGSQVVVDVQGRVVRVEEKSGNVVKRLGIAALIEKYNIIRERPATS